MPAPAPIDYATFLANALEADINALAYLASGTVIATMDSTEAATYQAQGDRLYDAGMLTRFRSGREVRSGETWYVFDGLLSSTALNHVAQAAKERVILSRDPLPNA